MKPIERGEILGLAEYEQIRERFRTRVIALKKQRRVQLGPRATVVFENRDTVLLQIQEMLRTERISREAAIQHEIDTYNGHIPGKNELFATVMIEIPNPDEREAFFARARGFQEHVALVVDGERTAAQWEKSRELEDRASAVNYLRFPLSPAAASHLREKRKDARVQMAIDHPVYAADVTLSAATLASLADDLDD